MNRFLCLLFFWNLIFVSPLTAKSRSHGFGREKYTLSICAIFQDEARFLKEWIEFHRMLGVDHFFLTNYKSQDDYMSVLDPYLQTHVVELFECHTPCHDFKQWETIQSKAYDHMICQARNQTQWLAILEPYDFLFPMHKKDLKTFLRAYENHVAVCVNRQMFGSSGIQRIAKHKLMIESLLFKAAQNHKEHRLVKSIVNPLYVNRCHGPNICTFYPGYRQVNENRMAFKGPVSPQVCIEKIRVYSYWSRDKEFLYHVKAPQRRKKSDPNKSYSQIDASYSQVKDRSMLRFTKELRKRMGL